MTTMTGYWAEVVQAALLGTDRRAAPPTPAGGVGDLIADGLRGDDAERLLLGVSACVAVGRAGLTPRDPVAPMPLPPLDDRPVTPTVASGTWQQVIGDWPVLEDEWLLTVVANGWRLAPELVESALARHRNDAVRHARVRLAAGGLADWLIDLQPHLGPRSSQPPAVEAVVTLPDLAVSPELQPLLAAAPAHAAAVLGEAFNTQQLGPAHRAVLTNLVARLQPAALPAVAAALASSDPALPSIGIALALADLGRLRHRMLDELTRKDHR